MSRVLRRSKLWPAAFDLVLVAACYVAVSYYMLNPAANVSLLYEGTLLSICLAAGGIVLAMQMQGMYGQVRAYSRISVALQIISSIGTGFIIQGLIQYSGRDAAVPLPIMFAGSVLVFFVLFAAKLIYFRRLAHGFGLERLMLVGVTPVMREIAAAIQSRPDAGMVVIGLIDDSLEPGTEVSGAKVLGPLEALAEVCRRTNPDRVIADLERSAAQVSPPVARKLLTAGIVLENRDVLYERLFQRVADACCDPAALVFGRPVAPPPTTIAVQAIYNNILGLGLLAVGGLLMVPIALLLRIVNGSPIREMQVSAGWEMVPFHLFRFRASGNTALGRWLRRTHLDGLPQLINVLRGEMALVGPRAVDLDFANRTLEEIPHYRQRFLVKPGLIGWSGIQTADECSDAHEQVIRELEYDLYYIKHVSIALDCYIVWHLIKSAFRRRRKE